MGRTLCYQFTLNIAGYTDSIGGQSEANLKLSKDRADAVKDYLNGHGLPATIKITTTGYGASNFVTDPGTCLSSTDKKKCEEKNRRVTHQR